mmetsp:Transcript_16094/g.28932  ORF Transcript_16094/g.28932 Transcript_16094/m.28932 type:complete len:477 (+) Transcript_16094:3-1433(+)
MYVCLCPIATAKIASSQTTENKILALKKGNRPAVKMWKMQAGERLKLHKAYTEELQKQSSNCFDLNAMNKTEPAEWLGGGPKGRKVNRAMGDRWRRKTETMHSSNDEPLVGAYVGSTNDKMKRYHEKKAKEARARRETWELRSLVARESKRLAHKSATDNDHPQERAILAQTLKDREKLWNQNDKLAGMAREVEVLSEKLRIAEGLCAKFQIKMNNQEMFLKNMELELEDKVPISQLKSVLEDNDHLRMTIRKQEDMLGKSSIREEALKRQLDQITKLQLMTEHGNNLLSPIPSPLVSPKNTTNVEATNEAENKTTTSKEDIVIPVKVMKLTEEKVLKAATPDKKVPTDSQQSTRQMAVKVKKFPSAKVLEGAREESSGDAVHLLQQYIQNLLSENKQLKEELDSIGKPDPKRDMFPEYIALKRENVALKKAFAKYGLDEVYYTRKETHKIDIRRHDKLKEEREAAVSLMKKNYGS